MFSLLPFLILMLAGGGIVLNGAVAGDSTAMGLGLIAAVQAAIGARMTLDGLWREQCRQRDQDYVKSVFLKSTGDRHASTPAKTWDEVWGPDEHTDEEVD